MHCSPGVPRGTILPVTGSTIFISTCGCTRPAVVTCSSGDSSEAVCVETGEVSVMPPTIVTSSIASCARTRLSTSSGQGAPPIRPVRRLDRSKRSKSGCSSRSMNIAGTP